jgi:hypothetical protein
MENNMFKPVERTTLLTAAAIAIACAVSQPSLAGETPGNTADPEPEVLRYKGIEVKPDIKFYSDYQIDLSDEDLGNAFHITRSYLGMKLEVTDWLSARVTYDVTTATDIASYDSVGLDQSKLQGSLVARLKYAYVNLGIAPIDSNLRIGVVHTPWIDWIEHIEDTRFLRKVMWEQEYHYPSADFGFAFIGHGGDRLAYHVGLYNGEGYHGIEETGFKDFIGRVSVRPAPDSKLVKGLQLSLYAHGEFPTKDGTETDRRLGGAVTWRLADKIKDPDCHKVEGEKLAAWYQVKLGQHGDPADALTNNLGMSFGARVELPAHLFAIGRGDRFDPDLDTADDEFWRAIGAFGYRAHETFHVALAYQGELPVSGEAQHLVGIHTEFRL